MSVWYPLRTPTACYLFKEPNTIQYNKYICGFESEIVKKELIFLYAHDQNLVLVVNHHKLNLF